MVPSLYLVFSLAALCLGRPHINLPITFLRLTGIGEGGKSRSKGKCSCSVCTYTSKFPSMHHSVCYAILYAYFKVYNSPYAIPSGMPIFRVFRWSCAEFHSACIHSIRSAQHPRHLCLRRCRPVFYPALTHDLCVLCVPHTPG